MLLGDGPDEDRYRRMTADLPNVVFAGFVQKPELPAGSAFPMSWYSPPWGTPTDTSYRRAWPLRCRLSRRRTRVTFTRG